MLMSELVVRSQYCKAKSLRTFGLTGHEPGYKTLLIRQVRELLGQCRTCWECYSHGAKKLYWEPELVRHKRLQLSWKTEYWEFNSYVTYVYSYRGKLSAGSQSSHAIHTFTVTVENWVLGAKARTSPDELPPLVRGRKGLTGSLWGPQGIRRLQSSGREYKYLVGLPTRVTTVTCSVEQKEQSADAHTNFQSKISTTSRKFSISNRFSHAEF